MSLDLTKVENYKFHRLYEHETEDGPVQTLEQVVSDAQRHTDRCGEPTGVYKLVKYTEAAAPRATVLDVPA